jgi:ribonuclease D
LIQITADKKNYIIDPLSINDISPLGSAFESNDSLKIFHSASDDIKALKRDFHFKFNNIADTMISSRLLGMEHNSLHYVVDYYFKITLSKTEQKSNWENRPLQKQQLIYASLDTAFLESLWDKMYSELEQRLLFEEARSEFEKISKEDFHQKEGDGFHLEKFPNILTFTPIQRRFVFEILKFREEKAKKLNRAPFRLMNNEAISELVLKKEFKEDVYLNVFGKKDGLEIFKILEENGNKGIEKDELEAKPFESLNDEQYKKFKRLRKWREVLNKTRKMDQTLLPSNRQLCLLATNEVHELDDIRKLDLFSEWKVSHYGPSIIACLEDRSYDGLLSNLPLVSSRRKIKSLQGE